jgi:hypothetical protein
MSNIRLLSVVGLCGVSVSVGAFIGTKYEKLLQTIGTDKSNLKLVESKEKHGLAKTGNSIKGKCDYLL